MQYLLAAASHVRSLHLENLFVLPSALGDMPALTKLSLKLNFDQRLSLPASCSALQVGAAALAGAGGRWEWRVCRCSRFPVCWRSLLRRVAR